MARDLGAACPLRGAAPEASSPSLAALGRCGNAFRAPRTLGMTSSPAYTITELVSQGGRVIVYRAVRNADHRPVILKVLGSRHGRPKDLEQLKREYEIGKLLDTPAVIKVLAFATHQGAPALVMDDFGGRSLDGLLGEPMAMGSFLPLAIAVAKATASVHRQGVIHKDLKPDNILVNLASGEVKLADFGLASRLPASTSPRSPPGSSRALWPICRPSRRGGRTGRSTAAPISTRSASRSIRCSPGSSPSRPAIQWSGSTATSPARRRRRPSSSPRCLSRSPASSSSSSPRCPRTATRARMASRSIWRGASSSGERAGESSRLPWVSGTPQAASRFRRSSMDGSRRSPVCSRPSAAWLRRARRSSCSSRATRDRQERARPRALQADRPGAGLLSFGEVRSVQARHPLHHARPGLSRARARDPRRERGGDRGLAAAAARRDREQRTAHHRRDPAGRARHRAATAGPCCR